jgi:glycine/D-amino acid oxidase-like deaminating enzyme
MVHLLSAFAHSAPRPMPPQRRRVIIIGAGAAGISAAFHLGEHSLLLERRKTIDQNLENTIDQPHHLPLGNTRARALGLEDRRADGERPGVSIDERQALTGRHRKGIHPLIHFQVARWEPPELSVNRTDRQGVDSEGADGRALIPLLSGELRFGAEVARISPLHRLVELADGTRYVYDKLLSTIPLMALTELVLAQLPWRIRCDETLRYWLNARDIEVTDAATRLCHGDADGVAAGKRIADLIRRALAEKFPVGTTSGFVGKKLFQPRLVMR